MNEQLQTEESATRYLRLFLWIVLSGWMCTVLNAVNAETPILLLSIPHFIKKYACTMKKGDDIVSIDANPVEL